APDLIDKPLAWAYFYRRYKAAVLFAHTLWSFLLALLMGWRGGCMRWPTRGMPWLTASGSFPTVSKMIAFYSITSVDG
ncbi:MAG: hypothetical protein WBR35_14985, partial [Anaerolineae bacterium]